MDDKRAHEIASNLQKLVELKKQELQVASATRDELVAIQRRLQAMMVVYLESGDLTKKNKQRITELVTKELMLPVGQDGI